MGILDQLEQESARRRAEEAQKQVELEAREKAFKSALEPAMEAFADFITRLTKRLRELQPECARDYEVPGYGSIPTQVIHEYTIKRSGSGQSSELSLAFQANILTERCANVEVIGSSRYKAVHASFQKLHIGGLQASKRDANGEVQSAIFRARGRIPLTVHAATDLATTSVKIQFVNFQDFTSFTKIFPAAQFADSFELIAGFITRESDQLITESIPDKLKASLKNKVQQELIKRKWEEKLAQQQDAEKLRLEQEAKLGFKLKQQGAFLFIKVRELFAQIVDKVKRKG